MLRARRGKGITTESAKNTFIKYGFMPSNDFQYQGYNKRYRVLDEVHNKFTTFSYRTLLDKIRKGKVQEVDPFLHSLFKLTDNNDRGKINASLACQSGTPERRFFPTHGSLPMPVIFDRFYIQKNRKLTALSSSKERFFEKSSISSSYYTTR